MDKVIQYPNAGRYEYKGHISPNMRGQALALGRNGYMAAEALVVRQGGADTVIRLVPINSRHQEGRCNIEIPKDKATVEALIKALREAVK